MDSSGTKQVKEQRVPIPGSAPVHSGDSHFATAPPNVVLNVTIMLRRPSPDAISADPEDLAAVRNFVQSYGLQVVSERPDARTIKVQGVTAQMQAAFGVTLEVGGDPTSQHYITYQGPLTVPKQVNGIIVAVLGLDQRPISKSRF